MLSKPYWRIAMSLNRPIPEAFAARTNEFTQTQEDLNDKELPLTSSGLNQNHLSVNYLTSFQRKILQQNLEGDVEQKYRQRRKKPNRNLSVIRLLSSHRQTLDHDG